MSFTLHWLSGSPYAWRVQLALVHKGLPFTLHNLSYDAGDFDRPALALLNPRKRVPVLDHGDFRLYESAAIVEYLEDIAPNPPLFAADPKHRAIQRRMIREADQYFAAEAMEALVQAVFHTAEDQRDPARIAAAWAAMRADLDLWESLILGEYLAGGLSAVDHALFPAIALGYRIATYVPEIATGSLTGPKLTAWYARMLALPIIRATWPPHWDKPA